MNLKSVKSRDELDLVEIKTFREAIRAKCYDCCVYDLNEVKHCQAFSCPLWAFRLGKKPKDEEAKETDIERELRRQARAFLNLFFSARNSIITSNKHSSSLAITYHFSRDDDNFPTAQEVRIAKDELTVRLQKTVDLWLEQENPQKPA